MLICMRQFASSFALALSLSLPLWGGADLPLGATGPSSHVGRGVNFRSVPEFQNVPMADVSGIVLGVKRLSIHAVVQGYNPSIVPFGSGYLFACRQDLVLPERLPQIFPLHTVRIVLARLDSSFRVDKMIQALDLGVSYAEDPRLFYVGKRLFLCYNYYSFGQPLPTRAMAVSTPRRMAMCEIDPKTLRVKSNMKLGFWQQNWEKNWVPLVHDSAKEKSRLYFIYTANPLKVLRLVEPLSGAIEQPVFFSEPSAKELLWEQKYGTIRGGTPALKVGSEYLTFFHSLFVSKRHKWYVFGAMTFEGKPPFKICKISPHPILFRGIYSTKPTFQTWWYPSRRLRVCFPGGFCVGRNKGKEEIYLVVGENDTCMKLIIMDKEKLLGSLRDINTQMVNDSFPASIPPKELPSEKQSLPFFAKKGIQR